MAPEIISGKSTDNKSIDWWSLGVITYQIMIGELPFRAETVSEIFNNIMSLNIEWPEIGDG
jgi:serine/threonine-protein kinase RIM15